ncbi:agrin isoform X2 [Nematostella vectensis]|uniref:agrin isoform X2 n=1 Tax=Nematostella vectensis TaxID=45351 RepID=UPI00207788D3|nr:agrin isoform X2 [Nematostella vectensis]
MWKNCLCHGKPATSDVSLLKVINRPLQQSSGINLSQLIEREVLFRTKTLTSTDRTRRINMNMTYLLLCITALFVSVTSLTCMCEKEKCKPMQCKSGYVKDVCGCCDVCAKTVTQKCGGYWGQFGTCAEGLSCVLRKRGQVLKNVQFSFKPGHCEPANCAEKSCGLYETCTMINNEAICECPRMCKDKGEPVCGLTNGKEYKSRCHLRKYECKIGVKIDHVPGPCKRCYHEEKPYKFNEQIKKVDCQVCTCNHGTWACKTDTSCINHSRKTTTPAIAPITVELDSPCDLSPNGPLRCPTEFVCRPVPGSQEIEGMMGMCMPREGIMEPLSEVDPTKFPTTTGRPLCPTMTCAPCKYGYVIDRTGCQTCQCAQKRIKSVCKLPKFAGPCMASIERFYYNAKIGKCQSFVFGGCLPNGNNFKTRKACEAKCML